MQSGHTENYSMSKPFENFIFCLHKELPPAYFPNQIQSDDMMEK